MQEKSKVLRATEPSRRCAHPCTWTSVWYCPIAEPQQISLFRLTSRDDIQLHELQDAKRFILGVNRGDYPSEYLLSKGFTANKNLIFTSNDDVNLQQLLNGRIDLLVQSKPALHFRLSKMGIAKNTVIYSSFEALQSDEFFQCLGKGVGVQIQFIGCRG